MCICECCQHHIVCTLSRHRPPRVKLSYKNLAPLFASSSIHPIPFSSSPYPHIPPPRPHTLPQLPSSALFFLPFFLLVFDPRTPHGNSTRPLASLRRLGHREAQRRLRLPAPDFRKRERPSPRRVRCAGARPYAHIVHRSRQGQHSEPVHHRLYLRFPRRA